MILSSYIYFKLWPCIVVKGYLGPCQTSILEFHWVKSVQKRSFLWSVFSCFRARKNSVFGHFSRSVFHKNNKKRKTVHYFCKKPSLEMFGRTQIIPYKRITLYSLLSLNFFQIVILLIVGLFGNTWELAEQGYLFHPLF